ncbi:MAG: hypothetical protein ABSD85_08660 [Acidimicrobiales bacterium]|jgi:FG-GAP repeat protein
MRGARIAGLSLFVGLAACASQVLVARPAPVAASPQAFRVAGSELAELKGTGIKPGDAFGWSVAVSGMTVVVGAPGRPGSAGRAYVFADTSSGWVQAAELKASATAAGDSFGWAVAISGTDVVVGAPGHGDNAGRAYLFAKTAARWVQVAELAGSDTVAGDRFGTSVAISGTNVVVGAWDHDGTAGRAYVFAGTARRWAQVAELKGSDTRSGNLFGAAVAISATTALISAPGYADDVGRAYVFDKIANRWTQVAELKGSAPLPVGHLPGGDSRNRPLGFGGPQFGYAVAISGATALVGEPGYPYGMVPVYVFERTATGWKQAAKLMEQDNDAFGASLALSRTSIVVGAPWQAGDTGAADLFTKTASGWARGYGLQASDTVAGDMFGESVAVSGETVVIGANGHGGGAGRAYLFEA